MSNTSTLGYLRDNGYDLSAFCQIDSTCSHGRSLDLNDMVNLFGEDYDLFINRAEFCSRLRCERCGRRGSTIQVTPPNGYSTPGGRAYN